MSQPPQLANASMVDGPRGCVCRRPRSRSQPPPRMMCMGCGSDASASLPGPMDPSLPATGTGSSAYACGRLVRAPAEAPADTPANVYAAAPAVKVATHEVKEDHQAAAPIESGHLADELDTRAPADAHVEDPADPPANVYAAAPAVKVATHEVKEDHQAAAPIESGPPADGLDTLDQPGEADTDALNEVMQGKLSRSEAKVQEGRGNGYAGTWPGECEALTDNEGDDSNLDDSEVEHAVGSDGIRCGPSSVTIMDRLLEGGRKIEQMIAKGELAEYTALLSDHGYSVNKITSGEEHDAESDASEYSTGNSGTEGVQLDGAEGLSTEADGRDYKDEQPGKDTVGRSGKSESSAVDEHEDENEEFEEETATGERNSAEGELYFAVTDTGYTFCDDSREPCNFFMASRMLWKGDALLEHPVSLTEWGYGRSRWLEHLEQRVAHFKRVKAHLGET